MLDSGELWEPEDFQLEIAADLFGSDPGSETWTILPEGNGKTTLYSSFALYHADYTQDAMVPIGASSRDQCEVLHGQAAGFVRRTPGMARRFQVYDGYRRIKALRTNGRIQVFAADDRTGDGIIPTLPLLDELHRHRDLRLYRTWGGKLWKRGGRLGVISTAGEVGSEFEELRKQIRTEAPEVEVHGAHTRAAGGGIVLHDYAVPADADVTDMAVVKQANPLSVITEASLQEKFDKPSTSLMHHRRFVCNQAVQQAEAVVAESEWTACRDPEAAIPDGTVGPLVTIDLGWKWDTTAIIPLLADGDEVLVEEPAIIVPPRDGTATDVRIIQRVLQGYDARWSEITAVVDPEAGGEQLAQWIETELGWRVILHSQKPQPMALAAQRLLERIATRKLRHRGYPDLTRQVLAAAARPVGEGFKLTKPRTGECIDGAVALAQGVSVLSDQTYTGGGFEW